MEKLLLLLVFTLFPFLLLGVLLQLVTSGCTVDVGPGATAALTELRCRASGAWMKVGYKLRDLRELIVSQGTYTEG